MCFCSSICCTNCTEITYSSFKEAQMTQLPHPTFLSKDKYSRCSRLNPPWPEASVLCRRETGCCSGLLSNECVWMWGWMGTQHPLYEVSIAGWCFMTWDELKCALLNTHAHICLLVCSGWYVAPYDLIEKKSREIPGKLYLMDRLFLLPWFKHTHTNTHHNGQRGSVPLCHFLWNEEQWVTLLAFGKWCECVCVTKGSMYWWICTLQKCVSHCVSWQNCI